jgi:hypothetical protein
VEFVASEPSHIAEAVCLLDAQKERAFNSN